MFHFEERHFEGKYGEEMVYIALYVFYAILFPCPYLWRDIVKDRNACLLFKEFCYLEVEAGVVNQNHHIGSPFHNVPLTHLHVFQYSGQV